MKTRFTVDTTSDGKIALGITTVGTEDRSGKEFEVLFDAGDAMQLSYLLEAAAVAVQAQSTGAKSS